MSGVLCVNGVLSWLLVILTKEIIYYFFSDFLMLVLKDLLTVRPDIRVVLMSATLNAQLFSKYFFDAPVIHIPGKANTVVDEFNLSNKIVRSTGFVYGFFLTCYPYLLIFIVVQI